LFSVPQVASSKTTDTPDSFEAVKCLSEIVVKIRLNL
jgi:hypothetical protein